MLKINKVHPLYSRVITTAERYDVENFTCETGIIIDPRIYSGSLNEYQRVISVGTTVHDFEPGDVVKINFKRYWKQSHKDDGTNKDGVVSISVDVPTVKINGKDCLIIDAADVEYYMKQGDYETESGGLLQ